MESNFTYEIPIPNFFLTKNKDIIKIRGYWLVVLSGIFLTRLKKIYS